MVVMTMAGELFIGTPAEIVRAMLRGTHTPNQTVHEYISSASERAQIILGRKLPVSGATDEELSANFIVEAVKAQLLMHPPNA